MIRPEKLSNENLEIAKNIFDIMKTKMPTHECLEQLFLCEPFCYYQDQLKSFLNEH
jgi:outer membrane protein assembly factor BamD (BamD/ComL family)